jgi:hypothetical protein
MILRSQTSRIAAAALLLLPTLVAGRFDNDFSNYPPKAEKCMDEADKNSGCNGNTVPEMNQCLCGDGGGFLTNTAKCIGEETSQDLQVLQTTFKVLQVNCDNSNTSMAINLAGWLELADPKGAATSSASTSGAAKPTETNQTDGDSKGGLPMGAIIGIAVGAGVIVIGGLAAAILLIRRRKKRNLEESHPMLVSQSYNPGGFPPARSDHSSGMYHSPSDVKAEHSAPTSPTWRPTTQSPAPSHLSAHPQGWSNDPRHASWNSQPSSLGHQSWTGPTQPYHTLGNEAAPAQLDATPAAPVFELPNEPAAQQPQHPAPVEMPASPMNGQQQGYGYGQGRY